MTCQNCGKPLEGQNPRQRFCGGPCRAEASRRRRAEAVRLPLAEAMTALKRAQEAMGGWEE